MVPRVIEWSNASQKEAVVAGVYEGSITDLRASLPSLVVPITVLATWHPGSMFTRSRVLKTYQTQWSTAPRYRVEIIEPSAHLAMIDAPAQVANFVRQVARSP